MSEERLGIVPAGAAVRVEGVHGGVGRAEVGREAVVLVEERWGRLVDGRPVRRYPTGEGRVGGREGRRRHVEGRRGGGAGRRRRGGGRRAAPAQNVLDVERRRRRRVDGGRRVKRRAHGGGRGEMELHEESPQPPAVTHRFSSGSQSKCRAEL